MKRKLFEIKENEVEENNNLKEIKNKRNYEIMKDILNPQNNDYLLKLYTSIYEGDYNSLTELNEMLNNPIADGYLAILYYFGCKIISKNETKAIEYSQRALNYINSNSEGSSECRYLSSIFSQFGLSTSINRLESYSTLFSLQNQITQSSSPILSGLIYNELASVYLNGIGVMIDPQKVFQCYYQGNIIDPSNAQLANNLGYCYLNGFGVEIDTKKASELFIQAALQGDINAQHNIGYCIQYKIGVFNTNNNNNNNNKLSSSLFPLQSTPTTIAISDTIFLDSSQYSSIYWYQLCANAGSSYGQLRLGYCYQYGLEGLPIDLHEAIRYYTLSSNQNNSIALYCLGYCYQHLILPYPSHHFTPSKISEYHKIAFNYYLQSACYGSIRGLHSIGQCYQHGIGVVKNKLESEKYYEMIKNQYLPNKKKSTHFLTEVEISPHFCDLEHISMSLLDSSFHPKVNTSNPHYLFEIISQFDYQPFRDLLEYYSIHGCCISQAYVFILSYKEYIIDYLATHSNLITFASDFNSVLTTDHILTNYFKKLPTYLNNLNLLLTLFKNNQINNIECLQNLIYYLNFLATIKDNIDSGYIFQTITTILTKQTNDNIQIKYSIFFDCCFLLNVIYEQVNKTNLLRCKPNELVDLFFNSKVNNSESNDISYDDLAFDSILPSSKDFTDIIRIILFRGFGQFHLLSRIFLGWRLKRDICENKERINIFFDFIPSIRLKSKFFEQKESKDNESDSDSNKNNCEKKESI